MCSISPALAESNPLDLAAYVRARAADADGNSGAAAADYAIALTAAPDNAVIALRAYRAAIAAGDFTLLTRARLALEKAELAPGDAALLSLAEAGRTGDAGAMRLAIDRIAAGPLDFLAPSLRAWAALATPNAAFAALDAAGTNPIARRYAQENRGLLLIATGKDAEGLALLQTLIGADSGNADLRINAAGLLAGSGHPEKAARLLAPEGAPASPPASTGIAAPAARIALMAPTIASGMSRILTRLAADLGDGQSSRLILAMARAALRLEPGNDRAKLLLATAIGRDELAGDALAVIDQIAADSPYFAQAQALRIAVLDKGGRQAAALGAAAALAEAPKAGLADLHRYADLLTEAHQYDAAADVYQRLLERDRESVDWVLYLQIGSVLDQAGHWAKARVALEKAVALAPDQPVALNYLGYSMLEHGGDVPAARKLLERASMLKPEDFSILDSLAWAYFVDGDTNKALPLLEKAAKGLPGNLTINEHLGDVYWRVGRRYEARYAWRAAAVVADEAEEARLLGKIANGPANR